jgi:ribose transport system substrate-binding protein
MHEPAQSCRGGLSTLPKAAALALAVSLLVLSGCGSSSSTQAQTQKVLGISLPFLSNEFFIVLDKLMEKDLKADGWRILPFSNANQKVDQQITDVNNLIAEGATALIVDPFDSSGIIPALNAADKAHVPVVLVDVGATGGKAYMSVHSDNKQAGGQVCDQMGKVLGQKNGSPSGTVLELQGDLSGVAGLDRTSGFEDCMKAKYPAVRVIARPTHWNGTEAANATQTIVATQSIDAIYAQSDCGMAAPVIATLKQAGKLVPVGQSGHIVIGAIDGCPPTLDAIRNGTLDFTVEQPIVSYAQRCAYFLDAALKGKNFGAGQDGFGGQMVTAPTGLEDLPPLTLVTKDNVEDPNLWGNQAKSFA